MKKIFLVLMLVMGLGVFSEEITPIESTIETLREELRQTKQLKDHYQKMSVYAETEMNLAQIEVNNYVTYTDNLIKNLRAIEATNEELRDVVFEKDVAIELLQDNIERRDLLLYESVQKRQIAENRIEELELRTDRYVLFMFIMFSSLIISVILFFVRGIVVSKRNTKPKTKTAKKEPLKAVKNEKTKKAKGNKTEEKAKTKEKEQKADQPSRFSIFLDKRRKNKDLKRQAKLEKRRAKVLTENKKDEVEKDDRIKENNKALLSGVMSKFILTIFNVEPPKTKT